MRLSLIAPLFAVLTLAACGRSPGDQPADAATFCADFQAWSCWRDAAAGRIGEAEYEACLGDVATICVGFAWSDECWPTESQTEACIVYLTDEGGLSLEGSPCDFCP